MIEEFILNQNLEGLLSSIRWSLFALAIGFFVISLVVEGPYNQRRSDLLECIRTLALAGCFVSAITLVLGLGPDYALNVVNSKLKHHQIESGFFIGLNLEIFQKPAIEAVNGSDRTLIKKTGVLYLGSLNCNSAIRDCISDLNAAKDYAELQKMINMVNPKTILQDDYVKVKKMITK